MTYLKLYQYSKALADCESGLLLSPMNPKLWYRKALALKQLGQWKKAKQSLQNAGDSEDVKKELKVIERKIETRRKEVVKGLRKEVRQFEEDIITVQVVDVEAK
eukprot:TRINITY_DN7663_c0_g1_i4.p3 TRINITY_DN7663_c0_g1~~TRINITY_DN7663_c0_g1_i4.p3  ORF type:complete len:104 (-),score=13.86 TRINITY_DN7663_c0_g1_i4:51-362(-)